MKNNRHLFSRATIMLWVCLIAAIVGVHDVVLSDEPDEKAKTISSSSNELVFFTAHELAEKIKIREVTSLEVVSAYFYQIEKYNPALNAIVTLNKDAAMKKAKEADAALAKGELWGPLHGVPVTIKDNVATLGIRTTTSMPELAGYVPDFDAPVVARLKKAGAIIIGKTNLPKLAMDIQTNSPIFGMTNNPWDVSRTPGGSSGGEAAAVAAGLTALGIGNDIGGSVRIPAHFCGIYSLKPTGHLVPVSGMAPGLPQKDFRSIRHLLSYGPLARSIDDLKLCLKIIAGPDEKDPDVCDFPFIEPKKKDLKDIRVAWFDDFEGVPVSEETKKTLTNFAGQLSKAGCTVEKIRPVDFNFMLAWKTYGEVIDMELGVYTPSIGRFFQSILGWSYRRDNPVLTMAFPMSHEKYLTALTNMEDFAFKVDRFLSQYDVFICPVHPTAAYKHILPDSHFGPFSVYKKPFMIDGKPFKYEFGNLAYTTIFNLTGNPVVVMPVGYTKENLPVGVQVVGARWHDMELLTIAGQLDKIAKAYKHPPGY